MGGQRGRPFGHRLSQGTKNRIAKARIGVSHSPETKKKIANSVSKYWRGSNDLQTKLFSEEGSTMASTTLRFTAAFLKRLSVQTAPIRTTIFSEQVNQDLDGILKQGRAGHLGGLVRRICRDLNLVKEVIDENNSKALLITGNSETLPPDISNDAIDSLAKDVLKGINKYQRGKVARKGRKTFESLPSSGVQKKGKGKEYLILKDADSFAVKFSDGLVVRVTTDNILSIVTPDDSNKFIVAFDNHRVVNKEDKGDDKS